MLGFEILGCASCDLYRGEMYLGLFLTALFWVRFRLFVLCRRDVGLNGGGCSMGWVLYEVVLVVWRLGCQGFRWCCEIDY